MPRTRKQAPRQADMLLDDDRSESESDDIDADADGRRPSKSALKRQAHELQRLGDTLITLRPERLAALPIAEPLRDAVELARRITARGGLRRQRQLIGRLMRDVDADAIREALEAGSAGHRAEVARARAAEDWRERLLADTTALPAFARRFGIDAGDPALARLIEQARAERAGTRGGGAYRSLYRTLLAMMRGHEAARGENPSPQQPQNPKEQP